MQIRGQDTVEALENHSAVAPRIDTESIIKSIASVKDARALPPGTVVGDLHGGLTFSDAIAAALEARSLGGWQEIHTPSGDTWTIIVLD